MEFWVFQTAIRERPLDEAHVERRIPNRAERDEVFFDGGGADVAAVVAFVLRAFLDVALQMRGSSE